MKLTEKASYIRGLMEGMKLNTETDEGKVLAAMAELLENVCREVDALNDDMEDVDDELDSINEDLGTMDDFFRQLAGELDEDDEDDEDEDPDSAEYELTCPNCGTVSVVDEDTLLGQEIVCPKCGAAFDIDFGAAEVDEDEKPAKKHKQ